jgi:hypothetical protein
MAPGPEVEALRPFVAFHATLRGAFQAFIAGLQSRCADLARQQLHAATSDFGLAALPACAAGYSPEPSDADDDAEQDGHELGGAGNARARIAGGRQADACTCRLLGL